MFVLLKALINVFLSTNIHTQDAFPGLYSKIVFKTLILRNLPITCLKLTIKRLMQRCKIRSDLPAHESGRQGRL